MKRVRPRARSHSRLGEPEIDLHGMTVAEAVNRLESALDAAIRNGAERLRVIHGHGTGRVRAAVHDYLGTIRAIEWFRVDPMNSGVTIVGL